MTAPTRSSPAGSAARRHPHLASRAERAPLATIEAAANLIDRLARRIEGALEHDDARADRAEATASSVDLREGGR